VKRSDWIEVRPCGAINGGFEPELVRRAGAGDRGAQTWLTQEVLPKVRKIARALTRSGPDADDATQQALLEILRAAAGFRGESSVQHWAGRIAARTILRYLARERRKTDPVVADIESSQVYTLPRERVRDALPRGMDEYLQTLPEAQRRSIVLHHGMGYSLDEVAKLMAVSRNTVKSRLRLGTSTLRKLVRRERRIGAPAQQAA
jgi:RNA polymerase sigma-70 factor (ECF subfamily)